MLLWYVPSIILGMTTLTYAGESCLSYFPSLFLIHDHIIVLTCQWLLIRRSQVRHSLLDSDSGMPILQFLRLLALALFLTLFGLGFSFYQLALTFSSSSMQAWVSWDNVHAGFSRITQVPAVWMPDNSIRNMWAFWSIYPSCAFLFFILFGLTSEAIRDWKRAAGWVKNRLWSLVSFAHRPQSVSLDHEYG